jgi:hypothetical protein|tara:strand:- start:120 stop:800 length:681 start_codon:yes stop_codon:yes gene_type:complete
MTKTDIIPCSPEEMDKLIEASLDDDFFYMLFLTAKTTGRRLGEFYGVEIKDKIGERAYGGEKKIKDIHGNEFTVQKTIPIYKKTNNWQYGIKVKDIDFEKGIMKVWVLKRRRFEQDETILLPEVSRVIRQYVMKHKLRPEDYLFRKVGYRQIQNRTVSYAKKAGIDHKVTFHNFRHYFITELGRRGWSHDKIAKFTGHKSIGTLKIYDHIVPEDLKKEALEVLRQL